MKGIALLISTVLATGLVVFAFRNTTPVTVDVLLGSFETPLSYALLGAGLLGALAGGAFIALFLRRPAKDRS